MHGLFQLSENVFTPYHFPFLKEGLMKLKVQELDNESFADFGHVISKSIRRPDHSCSEYDWWADLAVFNKIDKRYGIGLALVKKQELRQSRSERHMKTPEFFLPVGGDMFIIVGPPDYPEEPDRLPDLTRFKAFKMQQGEAVILKPGVWHYVPMPMKNKVHMFVIFSEGTSKDDLFEEDFPAGEFLELTI